MTKTIRRAFLGSAIALLVVSSVAARPRVDRPFPYDPACAWGRLSDGKGMRIRCLTKAEAVGLGAKDPSAKPEANEESPSEPKPRVAIELGPVNADEGSFPKAVKSLDKARDRYVKCIEDHGGLLKETGELHIRFLVRERGRAEGATVKKRRGVSRDAGKCVADVVDRRFVGYPESQMVGATLVVKITKKK